MSNHQDSARRRRHGIWAFALCGALLIASGLALAQTALQGKNLGALAKANLKKHRATAPVDLTGTYNFQIEGSPFTAYQFLPVPKLTPTAQAASDKRAAYAAKGLEYRDDSAACWPLGVPSIMTRYWPIQVVQLPTEVLLISMFANNVRWIYTDGRSHPADDDLVLTYNGHSIGHWEGKSLVVDTIGMTDDHHSIQDGIPTGSKLHVIERFSLSADGNTLQDEFTMTDPDNWVGQWKSTKHYVRDDHADIEEHLCIYEQMSKLPGFDKNIRE
jgi:hypothetical protein